MRFPKQEYWSGLPCPHPEDLPNRGIGSGSPALWVDSLQSELPGKPFFSTTLAYPHQERKGQSSWGNQQSNCRRHTLLVNARHTGRGGRERQRDSLFIMDTTIFFSYIILFINSFTYLFLAVLGLCCCTGFSLVVLNKGCSPAVGSGFLVAVASLAVEHRRQGAQASVAAAPGLWSTG